MQLPELDGNRALFAKALPLFATHPALSLEDCCLSVYAELDGATPLWTFDQKLARQVTGAELVRVPRVRL
jgi:predicted nucleic acid-binding protein